MGSGGGPKEHMETLGVLSLKEALGLVAGEVVSLTGAGGKTTLMFTLARELAKGGEGLVVSTTTAKIYEPSPEETEELFLGEEEALLKALDTAPGRLRHCTLASKRLPPSEGAPSSRPKLQGLSPELVGRIAAKKGVAYTIVEADGARGLPVKAPREWEPLIPPSTTLLIPVVGLDALGLPISEERVFAPDRVSALSGLPLGSRLTEEAVATLFHHPQGLAKGSPPGARIIPFINKVDSEKLIEKGRGLAYSILGIKERPIEIVLLGKARARDPVVEIIHRDILGGV